GRHPGERLMSSRWQEADHSNEDAATTSHCPGTEDRPALVADHYDSASGLTLTASRADLLKTLARSRPRSSGAGDTFPPVPYRPILARLDCHAWLSVRRPERRQCARSPHPADVTGRVVCSAARA